MNGIHDMGGMDGFGEVTPEPDEPIFHADWERRVFAMILGTKGGGGIRSAIESMTPAEYLSSSYYQKWLHARIETLVAKGAISRDELDARIALLRREPGAEFEGTEDPEHLAKVVARTRHEPAPSVDTDIEPEFAVGDVVQVRNIHPAGHTRLPRYVRGKLGQIVAVYGVHWLQDELPADSQPRAEAVYSMRFDAQELWGDAAPSQDALYIDMWESYLEDPTTEGR